MPVFSEVEGANALEAGLVRESLQSDLLVVGGTLKQRDSLHGVEEGLASLELCLLHFDERCSLSRRGQHKGLIQIKSGADGTFSKKAH